MYNSFIISGRKTKTMEVLSVLLVGSIITYLMYQNINKVTSSLEISKSGSFEAYAAFAAAITEHIRKIKNDIDEDNNSEYPKFQPKPQCDRKKTVRELLDLIRKTALYETVMAKRKSAKEVEAELGKILSRLDSVIKDNCIDGETVANEVRDALYAEYQKIHTK